MTIYYAPPPTPYAPSSYVAPALPRKPSRRPLWIAIAAAGTLVVLGTVAVLGFVAPGFFLRPVYDTPSLQAGVAKVLTRDYQVPAEAVACPPSVPVEQGLRFSCNALIDGQQVPVGVKVLNDAGRFEVARPS